MEILSHFSDFEPSHLQHRMFLFNKVLKDDTTLQGIRAGNTQSRLYENKLYKNTTIT
jgi:hypothetical protein